MKISIVIASAPDRSTEEILASLKQIQPHNVEFEILIIKGTHLSAQRNMGIEKATGEYIFLFDDDVIIPAGVIEKVLELFKQTPNFHVIGGPNLTPVSDTFLQHCFGYAHSCYFTGLKTAIRYYPANVKKTDENILTGCNLAFRSQTLKQNLFDINLDCNDETELLNRLIQQNKKLFYSKDFFVYHHRRKNIAAYAKQIFRWGIGRTAHMLKHPSHLNPVFFVPLTFVFYLVSLIFFHPLWYLTPFLLYLILDVIFSIQVIVTSKRISSIFMMPWLFLLTHISYGLGLLWGFLEKVFKKPRTKSSTKTNAENFKLTTLSLPKN